MVEGEQRYWVHVAIALRATDSADNRSLIPDRTSIRELRSAVSVERGEMNHCCKELGELFDKAQSFGCGVEDLGKKVVTFLPDRTIHPYIAHKSEHAFHEPCNPLRHAHERYNTDVTQMIF
jgi:hypothetical protein